MTFREMSNSHKFYTLAGLMVIIIPAMFWAAFVLQIMWGWFVEPAFGIPVPSIGYVAGMVCMVYSLRRGGKAIGEMDASEIFWNAIGASIVGPAMTLLVGFLITLFM